MFSKLNYMHILYSLACTFKMHLRTDIWDLLNKYPGLVHILPSIAIKLYGWRDIAVSCWVGVEYQLLFLKWKKEEKKYYTTYLLIKTLHHLGTRMCLNVTCNFYGHSQLYAPDCVIFFCLSFGILSWYTLMPLSFHL